MGMGRAVIPLLGRAASPWACSSAILAYDPITALLRCRCRCDSLFEVRGANRTGIRCPSHALANSYTHTQRCVRMNASGTEGDMTGKTKKRKPEFRRLRDMALAVRLRAPNSRRLPAAGSPPRVATGTVVPSAVRSACTSLASVSERMTHGAAAFHSRRCRWSPYDWELETADRTQS